MLLITGATGNIGKHLVAESIVRGIPVRALSRDPLRAAALLPQGTPIVSGNLMVSADVERVLDGVNKIYLATNGTDQLVAEQTLIAAAKAAGVRHIVKVSVIGASPQHYVWYAQVHAAIEQTLAESGIPATILRPNWFMENFFGSAPTIATQGTIYGSAGEGRVAFIDSRDTAEVALRVLTEDGHAGKAYQLTGSRALTFAEAAAELSIGLERRVEYVDLSDEQFHQALTGAGLPDSVAAVIVQINRNARENNLAAVTDTVKTLTGHEPRSLADFARDHSPLLIRVPASSA